MQVVFHVNDGLLEEIVIAGVAITVVNMVVLKEGEQVV